MANADYDEVDEMEEPASEDDESDVEVDVAAPVEEGEVAADADGESPAPARNADVEIAEQLTVSSKEALRRQLEEEMERFLAKGGTVKEIPPDVTADPPKKPESTYGSNPI
jgi:hypothetical protein